MISIGILDLQGDVSEHFEAVKKALKKLNIKSDILRVKTVSDLSKMRWINNLRRREHRYRQAHG